MIAFYRCEILDPFTPYFRPALLQLANVVDVRDATPDIGTAYSGYLMRWRSRHPGHELGPLLIVNCNGQGPRFVKGTIEDFLRGSGLS